MLSGDCRVCFERPWVVAFRWPDGASSCACRQCLRFLLVGKPYIAVLRFPTSPRETFLVLTGQALVDMLRDAHLPYP